MKNNYDISVGSGCMVERYPGKRMRMAKALIRMDFLEGNKNERSNIQQKKR